MQSPNLPQRSTRRPAFTLVELLVVIAIIAVLISMLIPALANVKFQAMRTKNAAQIKQFVLGFSSYAVDNKQTIPQSVHIPTWGETPIYAYMTNTYGPGTGCDLMPAIDFYHLRPLTPHVFSRYPGVGAPGNEYPPIAPKYYTTLSFYFYFPGYSLGQMPAVGAAMASPTHVDTARAEHVMFQDFIGYFPTLMGAAKPYSTEMPSSMSVEPDPAIGMYREAAPASVYAGCFDGSVRLRAGSTVQFVQYAVGFQYYIGHTQPQ
jgi:prepilin-type N-terminal cleavage/methylation domain-containing protein